MTKIAIVISIANPEARKVEEYIPYAPQGSELSLYVPDIGPDRGIETSFDLMMTAPGIVKAAIQAEKDGADVVVIESMADAGLISAREKLSIPVVGMAETSLHMAAMLGRKFCKIIALSGQYIISDRLLHAYRLSHFAGPLRAIDVRPQDIVKDRSKIRKVLIDQAIEAVKVDHVDTIVFGCSLFTGQADLIQKELAKAGYPDISVIDPMPVSLHFAKLLVDCNLKQNRIVYPQGKVLKGNIYKGYDFF